MTTITPEIIQAEIENLEGIIPADNFHIVLLAMPSKKATADLIKLDSQIQKEKVEAAQAGYLPIIKANHQYSEVKSGMGLLPRCPIVKGQTREQGFYKELPGEFLPYPLPVTEGVEYLMIPHNRVLAFQEIPA